MDWTAGIDRHRDALKRVLAGLVGMAGLRRPPLSCRTSPPQGGRFAKRQPGQCCKRGQHALQRGAVSLDRSIPVHRRLRSRAAGL